MTITTRTLSKLQHYFETVVDRIKDSEHYQKLQAMPRFKRWAILAGLFLLSQLVVLVVYI
jgi:ZIP family zinc transporter